MTGAALSARLRQALDESDQGIADDSRSTLPGYQSKVLVARFAGQWASPHGRAHSTHILKPQVEARPHRIFDEHYGHLLSRHVGLSSYGSEIAVADGTTYLAIERFDRSVEGERVAARHQEDLAQALGLDWRQADVKFQDAYSPDDPNRASAQRIGCILGSIPGGRKAVVSWIRQLAFTIAIGDNDAHAKNVAIMHGPEGSELAQIYDTVPNLFQEGLVKWDLALAIDGEFDHRRLSVERLLAEVEAWRVVDSGRAATAVSETLAALRDAVASIEPPAGVSSGMVDRLQSNIDRLLAGDQIGEPRQ